MRVSFQQERLLLGGDEDKERQEEVTKGHGESEPVQVIVTWPASL